MLGIWLDTVVSRLVVVTEGRGSPQSTHFGLVSPNFVLGLALGIGVPRAVDQGCSGHDELDVVAKGPVLVQLLCSGYGLLGALHKARLPIIGQLNHPD